MKRQSPGVGRPSKGARVVMTTRLPTDLAAAVRQRAEDNDSAFSDEIANAVAAYLGFPPVVDTTRRDQPLDMTA